MDPMADPWAAPLSVPSSICSCRNMALKKRQHKRVSAGRSGIHGWGAFIREPAEKHDFIYEYTGELVSQDEADRRGKIYDKIKCRSARLVPEF